MSDMTETDFTLKRRSQLVEAIRFVGDSWLSIAGAGIVISWILVAVFADVIAPFPPNISLLPLQPAGTEALLAPETRLGSVTAGDLCAPSGPAGTVNCGTFWLGTDLIGRDVLSRIIHGSRTVLFYAPLATLLAYAFGIAFGLYAGYRGGRVDEVVSFAANVVLAFPVLVLYVIIIARFGSSGLNILLAITFASAPGIMRIVRGLTFAERERDYVQAAKTRGEPVWRVLFVEILPNVRGPLIVDFCVRIGYTTMTIGALGFLGLGLPPPNPDWGGMINESRQMAMVFPHLVIWPCVALSSLVLGFNLLADGLSETAARD